MIEVIPKYATRHISKEEEACTEELMIQLSRNLDYIRCLKCKKEIFILDTDEYNRYKVKKKDNTFIWINLCIECSKEEYKRRKNK